MPLQYFIPRPLWERVSRSDGRGAKILQSFTAPSYSLAINGITAAEFSADLQPLLAPAIITARLEQIFDLNGTSNHYITRQLQSEHCLSGKSFRSRNKCGMTFSEFASSGRVIVMISECSSGRELLWLLSCRYKKVTGTDNSFYVYIFTFACLFDLARVLRHSLKPAPCDIYILCLDRQTLIYSSFQLFKKYCNKNLTNSKKRA